MIDKTIGLLLAITFSTSTTAVNAMLSGQSQTKPASQNETVRLRTELVQVQVVVTDKQGRVIEDLKKEDFELLEQGRPQEVSFFSEERVGALPDRQAAPQANQIAGPPTSAGRAAKPLRSIVLFLDTLHLSGPSLPGSPLLYYLMIYNARSTTAGSELTMQWEIAQAGKVIYKAESQPVASRVIGRDKKGIEIGGQLVLPLQPGLYELRISVADSKSKQTAQRAVAFAIES